MVPALAQSGSGQSGVEESASAAELRQILSPGKDPSTAELEAFWKQIEQDGAPLLQSDSSDANFSFVTFLFRGGRVPTVVEKGVGVVSG